MSFMVNAVTMESLIALVSSIIEKRSIEDMIYFFCGQIYVNRNAILNAQGNYDLADIYLLRSCNRDEIFQSFKYVQNKNLIVTADSFRNKSEWTG